MSRSLARNSKACVFCSRKKRRCNGDGIHPCPNCRARQTECVYTPDHRTRSAKQGLPQTPSTISPGRRRSEDDVRLSIEDVASPPWPGTLSFGIHIGNNGEFEYRGPTSASAGRLPLDYPLQMARLENRDDVHLPDVEEMTWHLDLFTEWQNCSILILPGTALQSVIEDYDVHRKDGKKAMVLWAMLSLTYNMLPDRHMAAAERAQRSEAAFQICVQTLTALQFRFPCVEVVQAACILACSEYSRGNENSAWTFNGLISTVGNSIGLHAGGDYKRWISSGHLTEQQAEARVIAYWAGFLIDRILASCLGRNCVIHSSDYNTPEIKLKTIAVSSSQSNATPSTLTFDSPTYMDSVLGCLRSAIDMWKINDAACGQIYSFQNDLVTRQPTPKEEAATLNRLRQYARKWRAEAKGWYQASSTLLNMSKNGPLPHLLVLHMSYHNLQILIHRPFLCTARNTSGFQADQDDFHELSTYICQTSAREIVRLCDLYRTHYTLQCVTFAMVHFINNASTVFMTDINASDENIAEAANASVQGCLDILEELAGVWKVARKAHESIAHVRLEKGESLNSLDREAGHDADLQSSADWMTQPRNRGNLTNSPSSPSPDGIGKPARRKIHLGLHRRGLQC